MLWASLVWWTGFLHIFNHLEPVYRQALCLASGLPRFAASRDLFLLTRSPPYGCIPDRLSVCYAIRLLFVADGHRLQHHYRE